MMNEHTVYLKYRETSDPCPDIAVLTDLADGNLSDPRREALLLHAAACSACAERVAGFLEAMNSREEVLPPPVLIQKTLRSVRSGFGACFKPVFCRPVFWMSLFAASVMLSFAFPGHYKQFLVLALVFGGQWLLSGYTGSRHLTIIADSHRSGGDQDEKNRLTGRHPVIK